MHELSITQSLFDLIMEQANQAGARKVHAIYLTVGEMTGVVDDSVRFYMEFLSKGTIAEEALLIIKNVGVRAKCRKCGKEYDAGELKWNCPACNSAEIEIIAGTELFVDSIEVDD
jgi:hydrogenase nickel incorporation protein HypA/HybF